MAAGRPGDHPERRATLEDPSDQRVGPEAVLELGASASHPGPGREGQGPEGRGGGHPRLVVDEGKGIDRPGIEHAEVQVGRRGDRVAGVADPTQHLTAFDPIPASHRPAFQVRVVDPQPAVWVPLPQHVAAQVIDAAMEDLAVDRGQHRRPALGEDVDAVVTTAPPIPRRPEEALDRVAALTLDGEAVSGRNPEPQTPLAVGEDLRLHPHHVVSVSTHFEAELEAGLGAGLGAALGRLDGVALPPAVDRQDVDEGLPPAALALQRNVQAFASTQGEAPAAGVGREFAESDLLLMGCTHPRRLIDRGLGRRQPPLTHHPLGQARPFQSQRVALGGRSSLRGRRDADRPLTTLEPNERGEHHHDATHRRTQRDRHQPGRRRAPFPRIWAGTPAIDRGVGVVARTHAGRSNRRPSQSARKIPLSARCPGAGGTHDPRST